MGSNYGLRTLRDNLVSVLAGAVETRDGVTGGHNERSTAYVTILLGEMKRLGIYAAETSEWDEDSVVAASRFHDVGKIRVSEAILKKPGRLTDAEYEEMKVHAREGERIIDKMIEEVGDASFLGHAKMFAGYHHERWDGKGYPYGLFEDKIPLEGRIMAVVDVYDALVSERPYKKPFGHEKAAGIVMGGKGTQFDPEIADAFYGANDLFRRVNEIYGEESPYPLRLSRRINI